MTPRRNTTKVVFLTADHLEQRADARASEAEQLPEGEARQDKLRSAAQLKSADILPSIGRGAPLEEMSAAILLTWSNLLRLFFAGWATYPRLK